MPEPESDERPFLCGCRRTFVQPHPRDHACREFDTLGLHVLPPEQVTPR